MSPVYMNRRLVSSSRACPVPDRMVNGTVSGRCLGEAACHPSARRRTSPALGLAPNRTPVTGELTGRHTKAGLEWAVVDVVPSLVPVPSCPVPLAPDAYTSPSEPTASVWSPPAQRSAYANPAVVPLGLGTRAGAAPLLVPLPVVVPSCPYWLPPHAQAPEPVMAVEWVRPALTPVAPDGPGTAPGLPAGSAPVGVRPSWRLELRPHV